jgi:mannose-6-phosphate isomerase
VVRSALSQIGKGNELTLYVSIVTPRLDAKPWGGRRLERLGVTLPPDAAIGEAVVTANDAMVSRGAFAGRSLGEIVSSDPEAMLGADARQAVTGRGIFPLLVKLIDASENLSIQVHPDDEAARPLDQPGKTEAWHVLAAEPGAQLYLGVRPGVPFDAFREAASLLDGSSAALMRTLPAQPGSTVLIPAGTIHALGAGVMVYEIQQPSDITYRLDDWGRRDASGSPRETHLDEGFAVTRPEAIPEVIEPVALRAATGTHHLLSACRYFALERVALPTGGTIEVGVAGSPVVVTLLAGDATIGDEGLGTGDSAVVWPTSERADLTATQPLVALVAHVPNLAFDVIERARAAGADAAAIAALGGPTGDVQAVTNP